MDGFSHFDNMINILQTKLLAQQGRLMFPTAVNVEDAETIVIGQTYLVPVVRTRNDSPALGAVFPVLGELHDDKDYIPLFPDNSPHWHIDWRFIPASVYEPTVKMFVEFFGQNAEQIGIANGGYAPGTPNLQLACVLPESVIVGPVERWPLPCQRPQLRWEAVPEWLANLEAAYKDKRVDKCNRCPHRGISLTGAPVDQNGVRVCPGHGLAWNQAGCLVPRTEGSL